MPGANLYSRPRLLNCRQTKKAPQIAYLKYSLEHLVALLWLSYYCSDERGKIN
jgi:hypothetical protein